MTKIVLTEEMIGDRHATPRKRPIQDVFGKAYDETNPSRYTVHGLGNGLFCVVPGTQDSPDLEFELPEDMIGGN